MRHLLIFCITFILCACAATYHQTDLTDKPQVKLEPESKILITIPKDGHYKTRVYKGSGKMTSEAIMEAFARHTKHISVTKNCTSTDICLKEAKNIGIDYLVVPEILHWEERATEWSGKSDRVEIKVTLFRVDKMVSIHSTVLAGKSKKISFGGDHPQDLLPEPINRYISTLY